MSATEDQTATLQMHGYMQPRPEGSPRGSHDCPGDEVVVRCGYMPKFWTQLGFNTLFRNNFGNFRDQKEF